MSTTAVSWPYYLKVKPIVQWPTALTPYHLRKTSAFKAGFGATVNLLERELEHLTNVGRRSAILQMALRDRDIRLDGYPRADARPDHPGIIVSIESKWGPLSYPCDTFDDWQDNLRATALALEALRKVDRYGVTKNGEQYTGFKQLGSGPTMTQIEAANLLISVSKINEGPVRLPGFEVVTSDMLGDRSVLAAVWRQVVKKLHHDGVVEDRDLWERVNEAKRLVS